jgi:hypothetical protein
MSQAWALLKYGFDRELTYNLTRPYPFGRSFKLLVFLGFTLLLCVVVFFSIANSAYEPRPVFVSSPNETEAQTYWFNAWVSFVMKRTCSLSMGCAIQSKEPLRVILGLKSISPTGRDQT